MLHAAQHDESAMVYDGMTWVENKKLLLSELLPAQDVSSLQR
jgi:hypothetical protein